ncbi:MAG: radical SAM protein [Promethearchaeota archaeon]
MLIRITKETNIPLFGFDFIGILDRGTNLIEIKPTTKCNLKCGYCYANVGNYKNDFEIDRDVVLEGVKKVIDAKKIDDAEAHLDPYGEILLYKDVFKLISGLKQVDGINRVSMQSNGTLVDEQVVEKLVNAGLDQINITINSMDEKMLRKLSCRENFDKEKLIHGIESVHKSPIDLVLTPVWFFGYNDEHVEEIVKYFKHLGQNTGEKKKLVLGIQNYLVYKTGRKLSKVKQRDFGYFYKKLKTLGVKHGIKLSLGPSDFGIHPAPTIHPPSIFSRVEMKKHENMAINIDIVSPGRQDQEFLGSTNGWGVKVMNFTPRPIEGKVTIPVKDISVKKGGIITAFVR